MKEMKEKLKQLFKEEGSINSWKLKSLNKENIYLFFNKQTFCKTCGGKTSFINFKKGYRDYCSKKCSANSQEVKEKREETYITKYRAKTVPTSLHFKTKYNSKTINSVSNIKEKKQKTENSN
jgi:hypothetical protein